MTVSSHGLKPDALPYESPHPECRVTATASPHASVRLDVSRKRAAVIAKRVHNAVDAHDGDGLLDIRFRMPRRAYQHMSENIARLLETDADVVEVDITDDADVSIMVLLNKNQIRNLDTATSEGMERANRVPNPGPFLWEISVSEDGARLLVKQLKAAVEGAEDPLDVVKDAGDGDE